MSNKGTYYLREFKNNDFMLWSVCSQCYNTFTVTIRDDSKVYATIPKRTTSTSLQKLEQNSAFYTGGNNLRVEIYFDNPRADVDNSPVSGGILDKQANTVGYSYTFCIEDADDKDYNDAYITIVGWRKHG